MNRLAEALMLVDLGAKGWAPRSHADGRSRSRAARVLVAAVQSRMAGANEAREMVWGMRP